MLRNDLLRLRNLANPRNHQYPNIEITEDTLGTPIHCFFKGECSVFKKNILWMKKMHYPNKLRSHLDTIVQLAPFTPKSTLKLRSALQFSYSIVIRRFISRENTAQSK